MAYGNVNVPGKLTPEYVGAVPTTRKVNGKELGADITLTPSDVGAASNPNLLDNWYLADPINQRGRTQYSGEGYTIDRWSLGQNDDNTLTVEDGYVSLHMGHGGAFGQFVETIRTGETYTFSVLTAEGALGYATFTATGHGQGDAFDFTVDGQWMTVFVNGDAPSGFGGAYTILHANQGAFDLHIVAVKLEIGSKQTLARKSGSTWVLNDPQPDPTLELAKCQRYYQCGIASFDRYGETNLYVSTADVLPVKMVSKPGVTFKNPKNVYAESIDMTVLEIFPAATNHACFFAAIPDGASYLPRISLEYAYDANLY